MRYSLRTGTVGLYEDFEAHISVTVMDILLPAVIIHILIGSLYGYEKTQTAGRGTLGELIQALNTEEPIWLIKQSYSNGRECVYSKKLGFDQSTNIYNFTYYYKENGTMKQENLQATLSMANDATSQGATMTVRKLEGSTSGIKYTLLTWEKEHHCGILHFQDSTNTQKCELHAWNSEAPNASQHCNDSYNTYCGPYESNQTPQTVYSSNCTAEPGC
ncbi:uncharacterized protein LOC142584279 [Dermacentor variabilis]|uniref:uncharacterized protein LOC142584279 n=1 Tax=Dermacentor variabilis TaxID=34621 RepID=UPI003F5C6478